MNNTILDGNHHLIAGILGNKSIKYIDLADPIDDIGINENHDEDDEFDEEESNNYPHINKNELKIIAAKLAQQVYDKWDESDVDTYANGGICHLIADKICGYLSRINVNCSTINTSVGENHVFAVGQFAEGIIRIDIPPYVYEKGGGYSWTKIPDVKITPNDVIIDFIDRDPSKFDEYLGD